MKGNRLRHFHQEYANARLGQLPSSSKPNTIRREGGGKGLAATALQLVMFGGR